MSTKIIPKLKPITPLELYLQQVSSTYQNIRFIRQGMSYIPPQFGGIFGQGIISGECAVLEVTEFESKG